MTEVVLKAGFFQFAPVFGDRRRNIEQISHALTDCTFDLMVLPELCTSGYQFLSGDEVRAVAEPPEGDLGQALKAIASKKRAIIVAGFAERFRDHVFNSAMTVGPDGVLSIYRKAHLFYKEKNCFTPGNTPFIPVDTGMGYRLGVMICFDWLFPESMRSLSLQGASVIAHPANLVMPYCQRAMVARTIENHAFVVTANRYGEEHRDPNEQLIFTGCSQIMSPRADIIARAPEDEAMIAVRELDLSMADPQLNAFNNLVTDRRPDLYRL